MTTPTNPNDPAAVRSFAQFVQAVQDGELHGDLTRELPELIASLNDARANNGGKPKGRITITFDFALDGNGAVDVNADYAVKTPKLQRSKSVFWTTVENLLSRRNPRQHEMEFRTVAPRADAEPARTA